MAVLGQDDDLLSERRLLACIISITTIILGPSRDAQIGQAARPMARGKPLCLPQISATTLSIPKLVGSF